MTDLLESISYYTLAGYVIIGVLFSVLFGIYSSHRVIGPSVAIKLHMDRLNYTKRLIIRDGDELVTVAKVINEYTDELRGIKKEDENS